MDGMRWAAWALPVLLVAAFAVVALRAFGASRWAEQTRLLLDRLEAGRAPPAPTQYDAARELPGLPAPVQRYFRLVLRDGQPLVAAATVEHRGRFNLGESGDRWKPFSSRQRVVTRRPGFVWDGRVQLLPGLAVHVHDAYVGGEGLLEPALLGLFTLMELRGTEAVAQGELMRYFAEAAWYPTALLPSQGVRWAPLDEHSAQATLVDGSRSITLSFHFAADGTLQRVRAEARGRTVGSQVVMSPWEGVWSDVQERDGMRVPISGEVAWLTPQGRKPYWRGTITALHHEFAR